jgi:hypothetical protein
MVANFEPEPNGNSYAVELLRQVVNLKMVFIRKKL